MQMHEVIQKIAMMNQSNSMTSKGLKRHVLKSASVLLLMIDILSSKILDLLVETLFLEKT